MTAPVPKPWIMEIAPYVPGRSTTDDGRKVVKLSAARAGSDPWRGD